MRKICLRLLFVVLVLLPALNFYGQKTRTLSGMIYFTNNTPKNKTKFPVELFTANGETLVQATTPNSAGYFQLRNIKAGKYLLKLTWFPDICILRYKVDLRKNSKTGASIVMDAACGDSRKPPIRDLPE